MVTNTQEDFTIKDIQIIIELKSKTATIIKLKYLKNLILKVAEVFRYQVYQRFILELLILGEKIQAILYNGKMVSIEVLAYFIKITLLMRCIIATISATNIKLELFLDSFFIHSNDQKFSIAFELIYTNQKHVFDIFNRLSSSQQIFP